MLDFTENIKKELNDMKDMYGEEVEYIIQTVCDRKSCKKCSDMDGKIFKAKNSIIGVNCPPFHEGCRCDIIPLEIFKTIGKRRGYRVYKDEYDKYGKWTVGEYITYSQWNKLYNWGRYDNKPMENPNKKTRDIEGYSEWRVNVFKRDNYTCQCCGKKAKKLNAHHLNSYNTDKEHRTDINNGITLCEKCHKEFHKGYGNGWNTKEQFEEWINNKN